jgi:hypothetical protein
MEALTLLQPELGYLICSDPKYSVHTCLLYCYQCLPEERRDVNYGSRDYHNIGGKENNSERVRRGDLLTH